MIVIPYVIKCLNFTDFSDDDKFNNNLNELLHSIYRKDYIQVIGIGEKSILEGILREVQLIIIINKMTREGIKIYWTNKEIHKPHLRMIR